MLGIGTASCDPALPTSSITRGPVVGAGHVLVPKHHRLRCRMHTAAGCQQAPSAHPLPAASSHLMPPGGQVLAPLQPQ